MPVDETYVPIVRFFVKMVFKPWGNNNRRGHSGRQYKPNSNNFISNCFGHRFLHLGELGEEI